MFNLTNLIGFWQTKILMEKIVPKLVCGPVILHKNNILSGDPSQGHMTVQTNNFRGLCQIHVIFRRKIIISPILKNV